LWKFLMKQAKTTDAAINPNITRIVSPILIPYVVCCCFTCTVAFSGVGLFRPGSAYSLWFLLRKYM
jgi:hypothetical protein